MSVNHKPCIVIPSYRAEYVLRKTVSRIPDTFWRLGGHVVIVHDASPDGTGKVADALAGEYPGLRVVHHATNKGYGGAQKTGLDTGLALGCTAFAVVHADGQYAPELVMDLLTPILEGRADLVQGSRMLGGGARLGGMPWSRYWANRILTFCENLVFGTRLAEFHSGYMLYSSRFLGEVPYARLRNDFTFDAEMIVMGRIAGFPCHEIAIPTRYDGESTSLKPLPYVLSVLKMMLRHLAGHYRDILKSETSLRK